MAINSAVVVDVVSTNVFRVNQQGVPLKIELTNDSTSNIYYAINGTAALHSGSFLTPGGYRIIDLDYGKKVQITSIDAISAVAGSNLCFILHY